MLVGASLSNLCISFKVRKIYPLNIDYTRVTQNSKSISYFSKALVFPPMVEYTDD